LNRGGKGLKRVLASYDAQTDTLLSKKDIKTGDANLPRDDLAGL
jgi:hypothetical protein